MPSKIESTRALATKPAKKSAERKPSFNPDRKGESSAGATGKNKKRSVAADRGNSGR
jgi:hypothetical protein